MNELKDWWALCEHLGPGAAFVLGVVCVLLWRDRAEDKAYMRQSDRQNLEILGKVTSMLESSTLQNASSKAEIVKTVEVARDRILDRIDRVDSGAKR